MTLCGRYPRTTSADPSEGILALRIRLGHLLAGNLGWGEAELWRFVPLDWINKEFDSAPKTMSLFFFRFLILAGDHFGWVCDLYLNYETRVDT